MKRIVLIAAAIIAALCICVVGLECYHYYTDPELIVTCYAEEVNLDARLRIVQLADLHGGSIGANNDMLVQMVAAQEPDLILMTGDMMDKGDENADTLCDLIRRLTPIAPVYLCYGNHEYDWMKAHGESLTPVLTEAGATVLDVEYLDITVKGQELRLGGYMGYYRQPGMFSVDGEQRAQELAFAEDFENTDRCKILLNHIPTAWLDWGYIDKYPVDLVLTGHYHGGQIRLPLIGGLYAPYVGLFPEYTEGVFTGEQATCVLSTGLGSSPGIPRINNPPQIVVVDLIPE
ncbi:MAG: metallophosphoesterase [Faecousia sp.]